MGQDRGETSSKVKPSFKWHGWLWIASMAALGAWIAIMAADRTLPTEYISEPTVTPDPVEDGGRVIVDLKVKRNRTCPGTVQRTLYNAVTGDVIAFYDPIPSAFPAPSRSEQRLPKTFDLPEGLPSRVIYEANVCFTCNLLQNWFPICTRVPSVAFTVIPRRR